MFDERVFDEKSCIGRNGSRQNGSRRNRSRRNGNTEAILIHIQNIRFYGELKIFRVKTLVFCVKFMSMETFT